MQPDTATRTDIEPWLRGPLAGVHPLWMPVFHSFRQVREDLARHITGLETELVWQDQPGGSLGFHLRHMAGSLDRLTTYLKGDLLAPAQLDFLRQETTPGVENEAALLTAIEVQLSAAERTLQSLDASVPFAPRQVGRSKLPTTVLGLAVHLAEHTQRHLGQCITLARRLHAGDSCS